MRNRTAVLGSVLALGVILMATVAQADTRIGFASDRLNVEFLGMTLPESRETLVKRGAGNGTAAEFEKLLERCAFAQFGGLRRSEDEMRADLEAVEKLLDRLDKELE